MRSTTPNCNGEAVVAPPEAYPQQVIYVVFGVVGVLVLLLVIAAGHRMVRNPSPNSSGMGDGMGNFIDVFDPARARADRDLKSKDNQGEIIPRPEDDDVPIRIDHVTMRATIKRPTTPQPPADAADPADPAGSD